MKHLCLNTRLLKRIFSELWHCDDLITKNKKGKPLSLNFDFVKSKRKAYTDSY